MPDGPAVQKPKHTAGWFVVFTNFLTIANPTEEHSKLGSRDENGRKRSVKDSTTFTFTFFIGNESGTIF